MEILVVEDTPSTQMLITRILELAGHHVTVASDGLQAIRAFHQARPDVVIMDLQMPILDGFQTTSILRVIELDRHVPIIATTARRLTTDKERFLAAGVDAFIAKPFDAKEFLELVETVRRRKSPVVVAEPNKESLMSMAETTPVGKILDMNATLERLGGDKRLLGDLVRFFFEDFPSILDEIRTSLTKHDWPRLERAAHSLKGLAANFSAEKAQRVLQSLETQSRGQDSEQLTQLLTQAERELAILAGALAEYHTAEPHE
ncbi:MAG: response regulator [Pirellulales bacterium]